MSEPPIDYVLPGTGLKQKHLTALGTLSSQFDNAELGMFRVGTEPETWSFHVRVSCYIAVIDSHARNILDELCRINGLDWSGHPPNLHGERMEVILVDNADS